MKTKRGFTLIELMIVVAIVALLAAIAFPSYARYVEKARRADGKAALLAAAQRLERCYTQTNDYQDCDDFLPTDSADRYYEVALQTGTLSPTTFTLTATPQGVQAGSPCGTYTLDHEGIRNAGGSASDRCWQ